MTLTDEQSIPQIVDDEAATASALPGIVRADDMQEEVVDATAVKGQAIAGVRALALRTAFTLLVRIGSSFLMARLLLPRDYGIFGIAAWVTALGAFLGDAGLAGALIRQHKKPTENESMTVFFVQQAFTAIVVALIVCFARQMSSIAGLPDDAVPLLRVMALSLFINSLRCIPLMALERELRFGIIARCELVQSIVNTAVTLFLAWRGTGAWSLVIGAMAGGAVMIVATWFASPWRPRGRFQFSIFARLARFGVTFQLNSMVPVFLTGWMPMLVGRYLGVAAVGFANWATNIASVPMMLSAVLNRVAFPAYSRLSGDPQALAKYLITSVRRLTAIMCVAVPLAVIACPYAIPLIFRERWNPAIPLVQWFAVDTMLATLLGVVAALQNAIGHPGDRLLTAAAGGVGRWVIGYFAVRSYGLASVGPTLVIMTVVELFGSAWLITRRRTETGAILRELFSPLASVGALLAASIIIQHLTLRLGLLPSVVLSATAFTGLMALREIATGGQTVFNEIAAVIRAVRPSRPQNLPGAGVAPA